MGRIMHDVVVRHDHARVLGYNDWEVFTTVVVRGTLSDALEIVWLADEAGVRADEQIVAGQSHAVLAACDVTLIASGTATLEAALFKRPMVIAYNMNWLSWQIMRRKQLQPWVGLPNILCRDFVVPELLQAAATPEAMARALLQWVDAKSEAPDKIVAVQQRFTRLHEDLQRDTSRLATDAIQKILET